jgi:glucose-6-phosphate isomerase
VGAFHKSFQELLQRIETRRRSLRARAPERWRAGLGPIAVAVQSRLADLAVRDAGRRLWAKDASLWKEDAAHRATIGNRLGWLASLGRMREALREMVGFAEEARGDGFRHAVLLGMGGSSLWPEVLASVFGSAPGMLELRVLDSTVPAAVRAAERGIDPQRTLFLVSSKSGTTIEVDTLYRYFAAKASPRQFAAITDPGTPLEARARAGGFRKCFLNAADIGGRYSALSYFGLVPAALLGIDLDSLLRRAEAMAEASGPAAPVSESPGAWLGAALGEAALQGRDKLTLLASPALSAFGAWLEQLIAESTGKEGKGIVPVDGEPRLPPTAYGADRIFVGLGLGQEGNGLDGALAEIEASGQPAVEIRLGDRLDLGGEVLRWEVATAVASAVLGVNAFDEPNVKESKDNTARLLEAYRRTGRLPEERPLFEGEGVRVYGGPRAMSAGRILAEHVAAAAPPAYVALQAYLARNEAVDAELQRIRQVVASARRVATTLGYGPRFLHSTGQLHKGGPRRGVFVQITAEVGDDLPIPEERYGLGVLAAAQAAGDLGALREKDLPVVRLHLTGEPARALGALRRELEEVLRA